MKKNSFKTSLLQVFEHNCVIYANLNTFSEYNYSGGAIGLPIYNCIIIRDITNVDNPLYRFEISKESLSFSLHVDCQRKEIIRLLYLFIFLK